MCCGPGEGAEAILCKGILRLGNAYQYRPVSDMKSKTRSGLNIAELCDILSRVLENSSLHWPVHRYGKRN